MVGDRRLRDLEDTGRRVSKTGEVYRRKNRQLFLTTLLRKKKTKGAKYPEDEEEREIFPKKEL